MPTENTTDKMRDVVERVQDLCRLATSSNENEARNAAMQAVALMNEHELAFVPRADLAQAMKAVEGAREMVKQAKAEQTKNMLIGGAIGLFLGKSGALKGVL